MTLRGLCAAEGRTAAEDRTVHVKPAVKGVAALPRWCFT